MYADDLLLRINQQQERELEQRLVRRLAAETRRKPARERHGHHLRLAIRAHRGARGA